MSSSNCCCLTCIQISQEAGQVFWYSNLFKNFPQSVVIHTVKGFGIVNKAEIDVFLELSCFFDNPVDVRNLISDSYLNPAWTSGSSQFTSCWSLTWRILNITSKEQKPVKEQIYNYSSCPRCSTKNCWDHMTRRISIQRWNKHHLSHPYTPAAPWRKCAEFPMCKSVWPLDPPFLSFLLTSRFNCGLHHWDFCLPLSLLFPWTSTHNRSALTLSSSSPLLPLSPYYSTITSV